MIVAERKPFDEIKDKIRDYKKVLRLGCGSCVSVCMAGVVPALNTKFIGVTEEEGILAERCLACGDCMLTDFGGSAPLHCVLRALLMAPAGVARMASASRAPVAIALGC